MATFTYDPGVFESDDLEVARRIILTPEADRDTDERWASETPYLADLLAARLDLPAGATVVDFGCGVGRMSKALAERCGWRMVGVDISSSMRAMAPGYVDRADFDVCSPEELDARVREGFRADAAIAVWVLQHCVRPDLEIARLREALRPGGRLAVVNSTARWVPAREQTWVDDRTSIGGLLDAALIRQAVGRLDAAHVGRSVAAGAFWAIHATKG